MSTFHRKPEPFDLLESNMEIICNELNGLLIANDLQYDGASAAVVFPSYNNEFIEDSLLTCYETNNYTVSAPICSKTRSICCQEELQLQYQKQQGNNIQVFEKPLLYYAQSRCTSKQVSFTAEQKTFVDTSAGMTAAGAHPIVGQSSTTASVSLKVAGSVGFSTKSEDYYLRNQSNRNSMTNTERVQLTPKLTASKVYGKNYSTNKQRNRESRHGYDYGGSDGGYSGAIRKYNSHNRYNDKKRNRAAEEIDYDKIEVNMEELGFSEEIEERNPVLRIMGLFRLLNYYLHDEFPFGACKEDGTTQLKQIARTMNIQHQVKNAIWNCTIFIDDKERILSANKLFNMQLYTDCQNSLEAMRKLCAQFETFKSVQLEHRRCQFTSDGWLANSQYLELILEQLNDQVRECNLLVHVFEWSARKTDSAKEDNTTVYNLETDVTSGICQNNDRNGGDGDKNKSHYTQPVEMAGMMDPIIRFIG